MTRTVTFLQHTVNTLLCVIQDCADAGWWMGEIGGRQGVFPDNFVKLLEVEKEVTLVQGFMQHIFVYWRLFLIFLYLCVFAETKETASSQCAFSETQHRYFDSSHLLFLSIKKNQIETCELWPVEKKPEVKKVPPERPEHLPQRDQERGNV